MSNYYLSSSQYLKANLCCQLVKHIKGPTGPIGVIGNTGPTGLPGSFTGKASLTTGSTGFGYIGYTGIDGEYYGVTGPTGYTGFSNVFGSIGCFGYNGLTGYAFKGFTGIKEIYGNTGYFGLTGTLGLISVQGPTGIQGTIGIIGQTGITGFTGFTGNMIQGDTGFTGLNGPKKLYGYTGPTGLNGYTGFEGLQGYTGSTGLHGYTGNEGLYGDIGIAGKTGTYANGPTGNNILSATGELGPTGNVNLIYGPTGLIGVSGLVGPTGYILYGQTGYTGEYVLGPTGMNYSSLINYPNTFWVSKQGNDNNTGSFESPFLTIQHAIDYCEPMISNYAILIYNGTYTEDLTITKSCYIGSINFDYRDIQYDATVSYLNVTIDGNITINANDPSGCDVSFYGLTNYIDLSSNNYIEITTPNVSANVNININNCVFTDNSSTTAVVLRCTSTLLYPYLVKIRLINSQIAANKSGTTSWSNATYPIDLMYNGGNSRTCLEVFQSRFIIRDRGIRIGNYIQIDNSSLIFAGSNSGIEKIVVHIYRSDSLNENNKSFFLNSKINIANNNNDSVYLFLLDSTSQNNCYFEIFNSLIEVSGTPPNFGTENGNYIFKNNSSSFNAYINGKNVVIFPAGTNDAVDGTIDSGSYLSGNGTKITAPYI